MTVAYHTYAIDAETLQDAQLIVEGCLGVALFPRSGGYRGGDYLMSEKGGSEELILQRNFIPFDGDWMESQHQDFAFLLYVNETTRSDEVLRRLVHADVELVRSRLFH